MMLSILRVTAAILYGILMLIAAVYSLKSGKFPKRSGFILITGAALLIYSAIFYRSDNALPVLNEIWTVIAALVLIHTAALLNGKHAGKINISHHAVRLCVSLGVLFLFYLK